MQNFQHDFRGSNVIVTGAAAGIGRGVALSFAAAGARVIASDIDSKGLASLAEDAASESGTLIPVVTDVSSPTAVAELVEEALSGQDQIDVLVNAAGGFGAVTNYADVTDETWDRAIKLNLTSVFYMCRAVIPHMGQGGRVITVSSAAGRMPTAVTACYYAAAKAGLLGLSRHLAREVAADGITVNCVAPGVTMTPRLEKIYDEERIKMVSAQTPIGRLATIDDQVGPIMFLASDAARYVTGATIDVNGGKILM